MRDQHAFTRSVLLLGALLIGLPLTASAATVTLNVNSVSGLQNAFATADANPSNYYIVQLARLTTNGAVRPYMLTSTLVLNRGNIEVRGSATGVASSYVIDAQNISTVTQSQRRVISVAPSGDAYPQLTMVGVTIQNGHADIPTHGGGIRIGSGNVILTDTIVQGNVSNQPGGGIMISSSASNGAFLTLNRVHMTLNSNEQIASSAIPQTCEGGALAVYGSAYVDIRNSSFTNNDACRGGGIAFYSTFGGIIENTTFSGNRAKRRGGALFFKNGSGYYTLHQVTIAENQAGWGPPTSQDKHYGGGVGFWGFDGFVNLVGVIIAKNKVVNDQRATLGYKGDDCFVDSSPNFRLDRTYLQDNIFGDGSNCAQLTVSGWAGTESNLFDPQLEPLRANPVASGLQTHSHLPIRFSPAIGSFTQNTVSGDWECLEKDQRGYRRPKANVGKCDIGAIEFEGLR